MTERVEFMSLEVNLYKLGAFSFVEEVEMIWTGRITHFGGRDAHLWLDLSLLALISLCGKSNLVKEGSN
jgi:hypothetical protein